jgi:predicted outer membrane lipoprotein
VTARVACGTLGGVLAGLTVPAAAAAHGIQLVTDLPIPEWLFAWATAIVLVVSFVALATLWPLPRLDQRHDRAWLRYPRWLDPACGAIGVALFVLIVYAGIAGAQLVTANIAPTLIYVVFWVGLALASVLFGDAFRPFNPWRAVARASAWGAQRLRRGAPAAEPLPYPAWLGRWPAAFGILCFAWLELVDNPAQRVEPRLLAFLALGYAAVQLVAMSLYGIETWTARGDAFAVYFGLFGLMAPLRWADGRVWRRAPFVGAVALELMPGTIALIAVMIGSTSFDGLSNGTVWISLFPHLYSLFTSLGVSSANAATEYSYTLGLIAMVAIVGGLYRLGTLGMRSIGAGYQASDLARRFAHTLLPISIAYVIAHYFSLLAFSGQSMIYLVSDPLGTGANIFGTANFQPNLAIVTGNVVWYVQVGALIAGHVGGLTLAHDRALTLYHRARDATRSQYWMLTVMVAFTSLGLWILSSTQ